MLSKRRSCSKSTRSCSAEMPGRAHVLLKTMQRANMTVPLALFRRIGRSLPSVGDQAGCSDRRRPGRMDGCWRSGRIHVIPTRLPGGIQVPRKAEPDLECRGRGQSTIQHRGPVVRSGRGKEFARAATRCSAGRLSTTATWPAHGSRGSDADSSIAAWTETAAASAKDHLTADTRTQPCPAPPAPCLPTAR
jgi:hypothetical protein